MLEIIPPVTMRSDNIKIPTDAIWYPLHGDPTSRNVAHPALAFATGAGGNWNAQGYYAFPAGNTTDVINSDNSLALDSIFSMVGMAAGNQWIIAWEQTTPNHSATGFQWIYGQDGGTASYFGIGMNNVEVLQFSVRGAGDAAARSHSFTGAALSLTGQRSSIVVSIEAQSTYEILVKIKKYLLGTDSAPVDLGTSVLLDVKGTGTNPGRGSFVNHAGLTIGARPATAWTPAGKATIGNYGSLFGNGTGNGRIGNFCARKFSTYDANRLDNVIADLVARPREFPRSML